ncbi:UDP-glucosyltransferase UGT13248 isoform X2 [Brachypodium distachyon]|uniref:UDP-glucosyltransferase UGT13248 isoform X2 n=1 Tax=Brachypodium distachyon TaxID=15368 RepID=UPI00052FEB0F|nr:UDP-glucosyltransferase UGT13248 isoform X2 [Brachypodium distachyon]|eukprot:XP_010239677.1 UDP-glucosyltransferase UGT13248 isoform X2 [Brachypodium distachyon]
METNSPSSAEEGSGTGGGAHVLLLAFPGAQGHLNPLLQFGRRLAYHGLRPTFVTTRYLLSTVPPPAGPFRVAAISDGFDAGGMAACSTGFGDYGRRLAAAGSETLEALFRSEAEAGRSVRALVYDPHLPWAARVARAAGVRTAAFFSQPCAVDLIYGEVWSGRVGLPIKDGSALRGLLSLELEPEDVPSFVAAPDSYRLFLDAVVGQFEGLEDADDVFVNSFHDLEPKEADYLSSTWRVKTIGPTLPSFYLDDDRLPSNKTYGFDLFDSTAPCMAWLDSHPPCSVVYASYGTVADLDQAQLEEIGNGLCNSGKRFLWVVRSVDEHKLSEELRGKCNEMGLIVSWCPQLEVLSHKATVSSYKTMPIIFLREGFDKVTFTI